jgi:hypothetical protein
MRGAGTSATPPAIRPAGRYRCAGILTTVRASRPPPRRRAPRREGGREVEAADRAVEVEQLAHDEEARHLARRERRRVHLGQRHAAARHLGEVEAARALHRQRRRGQHVAQARPLAAPDLGETALGVELLAREQRLREAARQQVGEPRAERPRRRVRDAVVELLFQRGALERRQPAHAQQRARELAGGRDRAAEVHGRRPRQPEVGEEQPAAARVDDAPLDHERGSTQAA